MMRVLAVASEIYPLVKTGGLADVMGSLPKALRAEGIEVRTLVPGHPSVRKALKGAATVHSYADLFGGQAEIVAGKAAGLDLFVLAAEHLFGRGGNPYLGPDGRDWSDNWRRFAALSFAAADIGRGLIDAFRPALVHAHDWQTGLVPAYLRYGSAPKAKSVFTIHNLAFQGQFPAEIFGRLGLPPGANAIDGVEYYGGVGYLKAGISSADAITTVSPSYAEEIMTPAGGMGLDGLLRLRREALTGIVNGIDVETWDPQTDPALVRNYRGASVAARRHNKRELERRFDFAPDDGMLFCVVSRLTGQKGMDLLAGCLEGLIAQGARLALLGSGEASLETAFRRAAERHSGRVGAKLGYDEELSHLLHGGADAIVVPSRFEPCGLTQLQGLRYGCVPLVSRIGGLADTIIDANHAGLAGGAATGVQFAPANAAGLANGFTRALRLYADQKTWRAIQRRGMKADVSWQASAAQYAALYRSIANSG